MADSSNSIAVVEAALAHARCVPFLGAGVSGPARSLEADWREMHQITAMQGRLAEAIRTAQAERLDAYESARQPWTARQLTAVIAEELATDAGLAARLCRKLEKAGIRTTNLPELHRQHLGPPAAHRLSDLCELHLALHSRAGRPDWPGLIQLLDIARYDRLRPTRGHVALAHLALEGCIEEVLTSNYDTCLERAFLAAAGCPVGTDGSGTALDAALDACRPGGPGQPDLVVVRDAASYAASGALPAAVPPSAARPCGRRLRIVKLNGCALPLRGGAADAAPAAADAAQAIILTETQLQDWRQRQWAKDLMRDRLRSRRLVFSGFGSAEPQVLHTLHQICEEWSGAAAQRPLPFFCLFREPAEVHLQQFQAATRSLGSQEDPLLTPQLAALHGLIPAGAPLSADAFWGALHRRLLARWLRDEALAGRNGSCDQLRALLPDARVLEVRLRQTLTAQDGILLDTWLADDGDAAAPGPLGRQRVPRLAAALGALHRDPTERREAYRPLCRHADLAVEMLAVLWLLRGQRAVPPLAPQGLRRHGGGLGVPLTDGRELLLVAGGSAGPEIAVADDSDPRRIALQVVLGSPARERPRSGLVPVVGPGWAAGWRVPRLVLADLWAQAPADLDQAGRTLAAALAAPRLALRSADAQRDWRHRLVKNDTGAAA